MFGKLKRRPKKYEEDQEDRDRDDRDIEEEMDYQSYNTTNTNSSSRLILPTTTTPTTRLSSMNCFKTLNKLLLSSTLPSTTSVNKKTTTTTPLLLLFLSILLLLVIILILELKSRVTYMMTTTYGMNMNSAFQPVKDPPWWMENKADDFFSRVYRRNLTSVRQLNNSNFFTPFCGHYRFQDSLFPSVSIIVTSYNEQRLMLTLTIETLLARTPPQILAQIVIVDDNGDAGRHAEIERELNHVKGLDTGRIEIVRNAERQGVSRSRMIGARLARGEVLVFIDSHVEMLSSTWLQHLLIPVLENKQTIAVQTLDIMNDVDWTYGKGSGDLLYGVINDDFWFSYQKYRSFHMPSRNNTHEDDHQYNINVETASRRLPYESPFIPGSLFAVHKQWFFHIGGFDEGMYVWGGENTDLSIKNWCCGGRIVMVPCSRVGHMYRLNIQQTGHRWPPPISDSLLTRVGLHNESVRIHGAVADPFTMIITRNNIRVIERWAATDPYVKHGYYGRVFGNASLHGVWEQFETQANNDVYGKLQHNVINHLQCRDFQWFDKHVYVKLTGHHHPWHPSSIGRKTWL